MHLTGNEDLRVRRTVKSIRQAFEALICEKEYAAITVTELAARAMINKKTFYQYYRDLDELLDEVKSELSDRYLALVAGYEIPRDLEKLNRAFFTFSAGAGQAYERITCSGGYGVIQQDMMDRTMNDVWHASPWFRAFDAEIQRIILLYVQASTVSIYRQWVADGKTMPLEKLIRLSERLIYQGLRQLGAADTQA